MGKQSRKSNKHKENGKIIDVGALLHSMDHARWDHPTVMTAFKVMRVLNEWLESQYDNPEHVPLVSIVISAPAVALLVGDDCVWESENCHSEDLTFDYCKEELKKLTLQRMVPFE